MWKIICNFLICILVVTFITSDAKTATAKLKLKNVTQFANDTEILLKKSGKIVWTKKISKGNPPISIHLTRTYEGRNNSENYKVADICVLEKKGSHEYSVQGLVLKLITKNGKCPIKKGTKVKIPKKIKYSFNALNTTKGKADVHIEINVPFFGPVVKTILTMDYKAKLTVK